MRTKALKSDKETISELRSIIKHQEEAIWQLRRSVGLELSFKLDLGLTDTQLKLFLVLAKSGSITNERGIAILAADRESKDTESLFRVHIHNMRKKLRESGIEVWNRWGVGYFLDTETLARVRPMMFERNENAKLESAAWAQGKVLSGLGSRRLPVAVQ